MRMSARISLYLCFLLLSGCLQAASYEKHDPAFIAQEGAQQRWKRLVVLSFSGSGSPESRDIVADWFAHKLRIEKLIGISGPIAAKTALKKHAIFLGAEPLPLPEAQRLGVMLGADALVVGFIDGLVVSASLIDVASGTVVATSIHAPKENSKLEDATDQVCRDMVAVLREMTAQRAASAAGR